MRSKVKISNGIAPLEIETNNTCPFCKRDFCGNIIFTYIIEEKNILSVTWLCPSCSKTFLTYFNNKRLGFWEEIHKYPSIPNISNFNEQIKKISPNFISIYNQSESAEAYKLDQIYGMGYRKALEFLIKDYCIFRNPTDKEKIKSLSVGKIIDNYIDNQKIKSLAKASSWLGNDETHYLRKHSNKDVNDLKKFIEAIVYFISYDLSLDEANELVSSK